MSTEDRKNALSDRGQPVDDDEINWVDLEEVDRENPLDVTPARQGQVSFPKKPHKPTKSSTDTVVMVETAFLASAASLVWLINFYFPIGPVLKIFFPIPIALVYLRRGRRASWMAAIVSGLLLLVLMGPTRSIIFIMPYGLMGVLLGACWRRKLNWLFSIGFGTILGSLGMFFRFWLSSILVGENLWVYVINQITRLADWLFFQLGILAQPNFLVIQTLACASIAINNLIYLFAVHLVALMLLDRLENPISRPPEWVRVLLDY